MKKALLLILVGMMVAGIVFFVGCGEEKIVTKESPATTTPKPDSPETAKVGETISIDKLDITVYGYEFSPGDGEYETPDPGNTYLIVDLGFVNNDTVLRGIYPAWQTKIHVPTGYDYDKQNLVWPVPYLTSDDVQPGSNARGFLTFEVPQDTEACSIIIKTRADTLGKGSAKILEIKLQ